jgi:predicted DNA-binding protein
MQKKCSCGESMNLKLRTVIFSGKVEIDNVPIYTCNVCSHSEVIPAVKADLSGLILELGNQPEKQSYLFNECNEWANILVEYKLAQKTAQSAAYKLEQMVEQRTNDLLDLYLLAQNLQDNVWLESIRRRLQQIRTQMKY